MTQYRPISLCIVPYKILTKVIVNCFKLVMPLLVAKNQTSFVKERHITDNMIITQEVVHSMRLRKERKGWMALKIDIKKAYDRLSWEFINDSLVDALF